MGKEKNSTAIKQYAYDKDAAGFWADVKSALKKADEYTRRDPRDHNPDRRKAQKLAVIAVINALARGEEDAVFEVLMREIERQRGMHKKGPDFDNITFLLKEIRDLWNAPGCSYSEAHQQDARYRFMGIIADNNEGCSGTTAGALLYAVFWLSVDRAYGDCKWNEAHAATVAAVAVHAADDFDYGNADLSTATAGVSSCAACSARICAALNRSEVAHAAE